MVSRKKLRTDGKKDTNNRIEEVIAYVDTEETRPNCSS